ncbi:hypothetical protein PoB_002867000, partial [Plakobranchus ocellatus]
KQKASLMMVPAVGGTVNRKFASDLKGVFCHGFELHHRCPGLMIGTPEIILMTSKHTKPGSVYRCHNRSTPNSSV